MNTRRTTLLIAIILAIGTGWLTLTYLSSLRPPPNQLRPVFVATQEIPARSRIVETMFRTEQRPATTLEPDAISRSETGGRLDLADHDSLGRAAHVVEGREQRRARPARCGCSPACARSAFRSTA